MKIACFFFLAFSSFYPVVSQPAFKVDDIQRPQAETIFDVAFYDNQYYCLSINTALTAPFEKTTTLFIFNDDGSLENEYALGESGHQYFQIYRIEPGHVQLIGSITENPCSHVVFSDFEITTQSLTPLAQHDFCEGQVIRKLRIIQGLEDDVFVQGNHGEQYWQKTAFVLQLNEQSGFTIVFDSLSQYDHFTVDFSKKGYVLKSTHQCAFYDHNWNFRKQRNNFTDGYDNALITSHLPFGTKQILDQVIKDGPYGQALRLVDSNFYIRKEVLILPPGNGGSQINFLPINGISAIDDQHVWTAANYGEYAESDFSFYGIARLDADLNILCNQFMGFDANYQLNGIRTHPDGSVIVFGQHLPFNEEPVSASADIFVAKYDPDCDLSTGIMDESANRINIVVTPNPGNDLIRFTSDGNDLFELRVHVVDAQGRMVLAKQDASKSIDVSGLATGPYFYYLFNGETMVNSGSWVKQ